MTAPATTDTEVRLIEPYLVAVWNGKGGVGKSLLSMALAATTAADNGTSYMVDIDSQATTAEVIERAESNGNVLPFNFTATTDVRELAMLRKVRGVDTIFVDCPGNLDAPVMPQVLELADFVIIPYVHDPFLPTPTRLAYERCRSFGVPAAVLINRVDGRRGGAMLDDAMATLDAMGLPRFKSFIREYTAHSLCHVNGQMITQYRGRSAMDAREDIHRAHGELLMSMRGRDRA